MTSEKEINIYLMHMRDILEDILDMARRENATDTISKVEKEIRRANEKIYQPPIAPR